MQGSRSPKAEQSLFQTNFVSSSKFVFVGSFLMLVAVGSTVFTVELEVFIVASQRLVWKAPTASFHLANTLGRWAPVGIVLSL